jgi:hypothetical protein
MVICRRSVYNKNVKGTAADRKGGAVKRQTRCEMMESLVEERKKELKKEEALERELADLVREREARLKEGADKETLASLDERIGALTWEREESLKHRKDLCSLARVVGAGD